MFDSPKWVRKKVQRLRSKGRLGQAIDLQRQLCQADESNLEDWSMLAELARAAGQRDLELAARVHVAKRSNTTPDEWLELAAAAKEAGFQDDAVEATFFAADLSARTGDCQRAVELCDQVLAMAANHAGAKRIRGIMASKLTEKADKAEEEDTLKNWPPTGSAAAESRQPPADDGPIEQLPDDGPATIEALPGDALLRASVRDDQLAEEEQDLSSPLPAALPPGTLLRSIEAAELRPPGDEAAAELPDDGEEPLGPSPVELRLTQRIPGTVASEISRARPGVLPKKDTDAAESAPELEAGPPAWSAKRGVEGPEAFVWTPQAWPSVLDWNCLMFVGGIDRIDEEVLGLADTLEIPEPKPIYEQGKTGQLLYCLDEGEVRAYRERGMVQDFGTISAGSFFGEVSTITGFPSTATVITVGPCRLRVFSREKFQRHHRKGEKSAARLLTFLRTWYMEVAANLSPLLSHCTAEELDVLTDSANWTTFQPGEVLAKEGTTGPLYTLIAGLTSVSTNRGMGPVQLGYLTTGDLVGCIDPSPVTITAASLVFALNVDRTRIPGLSAVARTKLDEHVAECRGALDQLDQQEEEVWLEPAEAPEEPAAVAGELKAEEKPAPAEKDAAEQGAGEAGEKDESEEKKEG